MGALLTDAQPGSAAIGCFSMAASSVSWARGSDAAESNKISACKYQLVSQAHIEERM